MAGLGTLGRGLRCPNCKAEFRDLWRDGDGLVPGCEDPSKCWEGPLVAVEQVKAFAEVGRLMRLIDESGVPND